MTEKIPELPPQIPEPDVNARRRGRTGLAISWDAVPWWGVIILILGVIAGYSVLTSTRYLDAIYFIFDLPWNRQMLARAKPADDGAWSVIVKPALAPGTYTLYAEYADKTGTIMGQSQVYHVTIVDNAGETVEQPLTVSETTVESKTSTPTITGKAPTGTEVVLFDDFSNNFWRILKRIWNANGVFLTIRVTLISFFSALLLGLVFGLMRVANRNPDLSINAGRRLLIGVALIAVMLALFPAWRTPRTAIVVSLITEAVMFLLPVMPYTFSTVYVEMVRGIPMLVIILYMGFAVTPMIRDATNGTVDLRGFPAAVIGLAFGYGAYLAEVYRAGIESISKGQMEAARSLGMSYFEAMRYVILPQAIRVVLPPLGNDFISMLKDSSLVSVIAMPEVLQQGRLWISRNFRAFEGFNSVAMMYLIMTLMLSLLVRYIERRAKLPGR